MRHYHQFTEPYAPWPAYFDHDAEAFYAEQNALSLLRIQARAIVNDARDALPIEVGHRELTEWHDAAQRYLDTGGDDDGEFQELIDGLDRQVNAPGYGPADEDFGRDAGGSEFDLAAAHLAAMAPERRAMLEREWL